MTGQFFPAEHRYEINGRTVPSVTQVLSDVVPVNYGPNVGEWHLQRGTAIHACAAMISDGLEFEHDPAIHGQVAAIRKCYRDMAVQPITWETSVFSERYQYAGTYDLEALIGGKPTLIDFKSTLSMSLGWQLAGYAAAMDTVTRPKIGYGVELHEDGTYKMSAPIRLDGPVRNEWLALLTAYRCRKRAGVCGCSKKQGQT